MNITYIDDQAFVKVGKFTYLCIGDEKEVKQESPNDVAERVQFAMAFSDYQSIQTSRGIQLN